MTVFSAYLPPKSSGIQPVDGFKLVPDSKAPLALIFPPFWLAYHQLWLELLGYLVVVAFVVLLAVWQPGPLVSYLSILPGLYLLLEGNEHIRYKLERQGWGYAGILEAENREDAETKLLIKLSDEFVPEVRSSNLKKPFLPKTSATAPQGLFPE